jgi:hypothetical protein
VSPDGQGPAGRSASGAPRHHDGLGPILASGTVSDTVSAMVPTSPPTRRPRKRCQRCSRFVARDALLCKRCAAIALDAEPIAIEPPPAAAPPAPRPPRSMAAPMLTVVRGQRTRCAICGRFVASTQTHCDRCRPPLPVAVGPVAAASTPPVARLTPLPSATPRSWIFERTRSEFVVPRPSEVHPEASISTASTGARGQLLPHIGPAPVAHEMPIVGETRPPVGWWPRLRHLASEQRVGLFVVAGAAATGAAVALLLGSR